MYLQQIFGIWGWQTYQRKDGWMMTFWKDNGCFYCYCCSCCVHRHLDKKDRAYCLHVAPIFGHNRLNFFTSPGNITKCCEQGQWSGSMSCPHHYMPMVAFCNCCCSRIWGCCCCCCFRCSNDNIPMVGIFDCVFFKNEPTPASFLFIFGLFKQTLQIFTTNICEKFQSSILCRDLNPWPPERESSTITTRPGLPPIFNCVWLWICLSLLLVPSNVGERKNLHFSFW